MLLARVLENPKVPEPTLHIYPSSGLGALLEDKTRRTKTMLAWHRRGASYWAAFRSSNLSVGQIELGSAGTNDRYLRAVCVALGWVCCWRFGARWVRSYGRGGIGFVVEIDSSTLLLESCVLVDGQ